LFPSIKNTSYRANYNSLSVAKKQTPLKKQDRNLSTLLTNPQDLCKACGKLAIKWPQTHIKRGVEALCSFFEQFNKAKLF
jgi:hypothetical protein